MHCPHHNRSGTQGAWWKRAQSSTSSVLKYPIFWPSTKCPMKIKDNYFLWQTLRGCIWMISNFHQSHLSLHSWVRTHRMGLGSVYYDVMISEASLSVSRLCVCLYICTFFKPIKTIMINFWAFCTESESHYFLWTKSITFKKIRLFLAYFSCPKISQMWDIFCS